jgi:hypothetical protein
MTLRRDTEFGCAGHSTFAVWRIYWCAERKISRKRTMSDARRQLQGKTYGSINSEECLEKGIKKESPHTVDAFADLSYSSPSHSEHSVHDMMHRSVAIPGEDQSWYSKMFAFAGPGALVAVGYMDPGNWTTAIGGGSAYNYDLLFVVLWSSLIALFFQILSVRLAIATEKDLAQACKQYYPAHVNTVLWLAAEVAIIATDLAEVLGSAIAMQLLFGWRLEIGVLVTAGDVVLVFLTQVSVLGGRQRKFFLFSTGNGAYPFLSLLHG